MFCLLQFFSLLCAADSSVFQSQSERVVPRSRSTATMGRSAAGVDAVEAAVNNAAAQEAVRVAERQAVATAAASLSGRKRKRDAEEDDDGPRAAKRRRSAVVPVRPAMLLTLPPLQLLVDACRDLFDRFYTPPTTAVVVRLIRRLMDRIRPDDVGLRDDFRFSHGNTASHRNPPIITYKSIIRSKNFEIAVFFLPKGAVMPLHDHPGMTVFSKLLIGSAHVEGYDWIRHPRTFSTISGSRMLAEKVLDRDVTPASGAWALFPDAGGNLHRFVAGEEMPCAFLDVLTPPYAPTERRRCTYYRKFPCSLCACWRTSGLTEEQRRPGKLAWLQEVAKPKDIRIMSLQYRKPIIYLLGSSSSCAADYFVWFLGGADHRSKLCMPCRIKS